MIGKKTVASITRSMQKMIAELEAHCDLKIKEANEYSLLAQEAGNEADQADKISYKLKGIFGDG